MKIRDDYPPGVYPSLLSHAGQTTMVAAHPGTGLVEWKWEDGKPILSNRAIVDSQVTTKGYARLTVIDGQRFCGYLIDEQPKTFAVWRNLESGIRSTWQVECKGNDPIAWGSDGWLYVQVKPADAYTILKGHYPNEPTIPVGPGETKGIHHIADSGLPVLWEDIYRTWPADFQQRRSCEGAEVGVTTDDRIVCEIGAVRGFLAPDLRVKNPDICRQENGKYTIAAWVAGSQGPIRMVVLADVTAEDLQPARLPALSDLVPFNRPAVTGAFAFSLGQPVAPGQPRRPAPPGRVVVPIRPVDAWLAEIEGSQVIATLAEYQQVVDDRLYALYAGEDAGHGDTFAGALAKVRPAADSRRVGIVAYAETNDPRDEDLAQLKPWDRYLLQCFLELDESIDAGLLRVSRASAKVKAAGVRMLGGVGLHRRATASHPGLRDRDVAEFLICASEIAARDQWDGAIGFRVGLSDLVTAALPFAVAWFGTATALPAVLRPATAPRPEPRPSPPTPIPSPVPIPEETDMIALGVPIKVTGMGEPVLNDDGSISIKTKDGKWVRLDSFGTVDTTTNHGGDERYLKGKNGLIATGRANEAFIVPYVEV